MNKAELYATANGLQRRDASFVLREKISSLSWGPEETVLDVGCGAGDVTASLLLPLLPPGFRRLLGVDLSPAMVRHAETQHRHPRLHFLQADIASKDLRETDLWRRAGAGGFTKIFSFFCLHWVPEQRVAIDNLHKLLRPGGEALLVFLGSCPVFSMYEALTRRPRWQPYMHDVKRYISPYHHSADPVREFSDLARDVGFQVVDCSCRERSFSFDSLACLKDSLKAVNPFLDRVPADQQSDFLVDCLYVTHRLKLATLAEPNNNNIDGGDNQDGKLTTCYNLMVAHIKK